MPRDPMTVLLRLRRMTADEAQRALAECLRAETASAAAVRLVETEIEQETETVCAIETDDRAVEEFGAWFRRIRKEQQAAAFAMQQAEGRTHEARTVLAASRAALQAVEEVMAKREAERQAAEARAEQRQLDEMARIRNA